MIRNRRSFGLGWQAARHASPDHHVFGIIFMVALLALIVIAVVVLTVWLIKHARNHQAAAVAGPAGGAALDILKARYARGEIDKVEYEEKRKDLST